MILPTGESLPFCPSPTALAEGMRSSECNGGNPGIWQTTDGRIWFPTMRGVVAIDPAAVNRVPPPVVLEEATADKVTLARDGRTSVPRRQQYVRFPLHGTEPLRAGKTALQVPARTL